MTNAGWEVESEFGQYTGDCVWAAVAMGEHMLSPYKHPLPDYAHLNSLTTAAIDAGIGVGAEGQATPGQLKEMLTRWGMRYSIGHDYDGTTLDATSLQQILIAATGRHRPVLLGFTNGQALPGDEMGLHGHAIAVLHNLGRNVYATGDGDNPLCRQGQLAVYTLSTLEAAAPDSAYVLEEVPGQMLQIQETNGFYTETVPGQVWHSANGWDVQHGVLDFFREVAPITGLALPLENLRTLPEKVAGKGLCYEQRFERFLIRYDPARQYDSPPGAPADSYFGHVEAGSPVLHVNGQTVASPYTISIVAG